MCMYLCNGCVKTVFVYAPSVCDWMRERENFWQVFLHEQRWTSSYRAWPQNLHTIYINILSMWYGYEIQNNMVKQLQTMQEYITYAQSIFAHYATNLVYSNATNVLWKQHSAFIKQLHNSSRYCRRIKITPIMLLIKSFDHEFSSFQLKTK